MSVNLSWLALIPSVLFILTGLISLVQYGMRPFFLRKFSLFTAGIGILAAFTVIFHAFLIGTQEVSFWTWNGLGFSFRLDPLSSLMLLMISLLAFIILHYSGNYLDGDGNQGSFLGRLAITFACVEILVLSGNLMILGIAWILTSISLHFLLIYYPERKAALIAAKKKFILARVGDVCLILAFYLIYQNFGTGDLGIIFSSLDALASMNQDLVLASVLIAFAAIFKSAQFPFWGWLVEVMETPTPVSALLHAGILNAGPFLVVRFSSLMQNSETASIVLVVFGGLTALLASVSLLTQPSIKVALAYSSAAHMGFMLLVCGLGVYPAVMLHLIAHSFYKAHAFLSSGSIVDSLRSAKVTMPTRLGSIPRLVISFILAFFIYTIFAYAWGIHWDDPKDLPLLAIGSIFVLGITLMLSPSIDSNGTIVSIFRILLLAIATTTAFFTLEYLMHSALHSEVPGRIELTSVRIVLTILQIISFFIVIFMQSIAPTISTKPMYRAWSIHFRNGLYVNAIFDRIVGSLKHNFSNGESHV